MDKFEQIFRKNRYELNVAARKSQSWFQQQAFNLGRKQIRPERLIRDNPSNNTLRIIPGELYLFSYDAKLKDELPFWDTFPLVFPFKKLDDGFLGLNMHYLPYQLRVALLSKLMSFKVGSVSDDVRLKLSWGTLQGMSQHQLVQPCVKRYLTSHVKSPFKKIDSDDWTTAMMLPVERFAGASKQRVWRESMK